MTFPDDFINKVICGDCLEVMREIPDGAVDLVVTDPPYNVGLEYGNYEDNRAESEYADFIEQAVRLMMKCGPFLIITPGKANEVLYYRKFEILDSCVWWKKFALTNGSVYNAMVTEPILFIGVKPNSKRLRTDLLEFSTDRIPGLGNHPCPKPVALFSELIFRFTDPGAIVLDPFLGSGTTAVAAKQLGRRFIGIEINPDYCKIAEDRLRQCEMELKV